MKAKLILENGMIFEGKAFGYLKESVGEVVFTTGMTGYQEVLTDPSYYGQIVTMTYPLIGNYGINLEDMESDGIKVRGFIVREKCDLPSNFRCELELEDFLKQGKVIGLEGIDTRALTKVLRNNGTMRGIIALEDLDDETVKEKIANFSNTEAVKKVTTKEAYTIDGSGKHVAIMDFGIKTNIIRNFQKRNCKLTIFPATATVKDLEENIVHITSQNHGYVVETLPENMEVTHVNINDGTVEGMKHKDLPIYSVQFHPEASAGPKDSEYIFDKFLKYAL